MASTTPHLQPPLCLTRNAVRGLGLLAALFGGVTVSAVEHPESTAQSHSYVVEVPVVSAKAIEVTRTVERPIKTCERVGYSARPREESLSVHRYSR